MLFIVNTIPVAKPASSKEALDPVGSTTSLDAIRDPTDPFILFVIITSVCPGSSILPVVTVYVNLISVLFISNFNRLLMFVDIKPNVAKYSPCLFTQASNVAGTSGYLNIDAVAEYVEYIVCCWYSVPFILSVNVFPSDCVPVKRTLECSMWKSAVLPTSTLFTSNGTFGYSLFITIEFKNGDEKPPIYSSSAFIPNKLSLK